MIGEVNLVQLDLLRGLQSELTRIVQVEFVVLEQVRQKCNMHARRCTSVDNILGEVTIGGQKVDLNN